MMSDLIKEDGGSRYLGLLDQARELSVQIREALFVPSPLVRALAPEWPPDLIAYELNRLIEPDISRERQRSALAGLIARRRGGRAVLYVRRDHWSRYLRPVASSDGVALRTYVAPPTLAPILRRLAPLWRLPHRRTVVSRKIRRGDGPLPETVVAARYWHRGLSVDAERRSELFWLGGRPLAGSRLLIYDHPGPERMPPELIEELARRHIEVVRGPAPFAFARSPRIIRAAFSKAVRLSATRILRLGRGGNGADWIFTKMIGLILGEATWIGFFGAHRVRVNLVTMINGSVAQVLAMRALGGVSASYQYSLSNIVTPTAIMFAGEDVQFLFSRDLETLWRRSVRPPAAEYVSTGFIFDGAVALTASGDRASSVRHTMRAAGAKFVIAFFDESSRDHWETWASNADAAREYEVLLGWVRDDPELGLVLKPKRPVDLRQRVASIVPALDELMATGRVVLLDDTGGPGSGSGPRADRPFYSEVYPAEAARIADVCIGKLFGATAAFEARLAGTPTILVDTERVHDHPFYKWARGTVVFEDWEEAREAISRYRGDLPAARALGDWSPGMAFLDPYADGRAAERMRQYVEHLAAALAAGASPREAIRAASLQLGAA